MINTVKWSPDWYSYKKRKSGHRPTQREDLAKTQGEDNPLNPRAEASEETKPVHTWLLAVSAGLAGRRFTDGSAVTLRVWWGCPHGAPNSRRASSQEAYFHSNSASAGFSFVFTGAHRNIHICVCWFYMSIPLHTVPPELSYTLPLLVHSTLS